MGFFKWLDKYDDFIVSVFKWLLVIVVIIFAAALEQKRDKEVIKEAIQEIKTNKL